MYLCRTVVSSAASTVQSRTGNTNELCPTQWSLLLLLRRKLSFDVKECQNIYLLKHIFAIPLYWFSLFSVRFRTPSVAPLRTHQLMVVTPPDRRIRQTATKACSTAGWMRDDSFMLDGYVDDGRYGRTNNNRCAPFYKCYAPFWWYREYQNSYMCPLNNQCFIRLAFFSNLNLKARIKV